jgi:putative copper resistance protein D
VHAFYEAVVVLHLIAAMTWLGGMFFLVLVVVPWLRKGDRATAARLLQETGTRFRSVGWACFVTLLATGVMLLDFRGVDLSHFGEAWWRAGPFGSAVLWKLAVFGAILAVSAWHDFSVGPRATRAIQADPKSAEAERLRVLASRLGRLNVALGLVILSLAVILVRGWPV